MAAEDGFTVRIRFNNDGGPLYSYLLQFPQNITKIKRIRQLTYLGLLVESGRVGGGGPPVFPCMPSHAVQPQAPAENAQSPITAPQRALTKSAVKEVVIDPYDVLTAFGISLDSGVEI